MVAFCGEGGVAVPQPVHHGAAGDNDGGKQSADAVLEGRKLRNKAKCQIKSHLTATGSQIYVGFSSSPHGLPPETLHTAPGYSAEILGQSSGRGPRRSRWLSASTSSGPQMHLLSCFTGVSYLLQALHMQHAMKKRFFFIEPKDIFTETKDRKAKYLGRDFYISTKSDMLLFTSGAKSKKKRVLTSRA